MVPSTLQKRTSHLGRHSPFFEGFRTQPARPTSTCGRADSVDATSPKYSPNTPQPIHTTSRMLHTLKKCQDENARYTEMGNVSNRSNSPSM
eukprot:2597587-Prymnesium_polylepis.1